MVLVAEVEVAVGVRDDNDNGGRGSGDDDGQGLISLFYLNQGCCRQSDAVALLAGSIKF